MATQNRRSINWLEQHLPEGLAVDAAWMTAHGFSTGLRSQYVTAGWLKQPARRVYQRARGTLGWQQLVLSLQTLLERDLSVGGRTALELQGYAHYLRQAAQTVMLYGPEPPPTWLRDLKTDATFLYRNDARLFTTERVSTAPHTLTIEPVKTGERPDSLLAQPWGQWNWPLVISTPERAILELLDELPDHEDFHQADALMAGLSTLRPNRLQKLLTDCHSVKVKRLFFYLAERHQHAWLRKLNRKSVDLGSGRRMIVKGGRFDAKHLITVPKDLDAVS